MLFEARKIKLREHDGGKDDGTAEILARGHRFAEQESRADNAKYRFERHYYRGDGGVEVALRHDLQGVGDTA